ncbi:MAG TPA: pitrilysin family protein [Gammaproteobacteria bacterium]|nr:pitrilysin family protein [Gammaproteobacteria bacterium]
MICKFQSALLITALSAALIACDDAEQDSMVLDGQNEASMSGVSADAVTAELDPDEVILMDNMAQPETIQDASDADDGSEMGAVVDEFLAGIDLSNRTTIERVVSPGGIEAWLVEESAVPVIAVEIGFAGGARLDPPGKEGLANMLSGLLDEGAGELDSQAFQTRLEDLSIRLRFNVGLDGFYGGVRTRTETRDEAFDLLRLALTQPRFDEEPVERIRAQLLVSLNRDKTQPNAIARRKWFETAFGEHPYARPVKGTPESLTTIADLDLRAYAKSMLGQGNLKIAVVGDIDAKALATLLDKTFGALIEESAPVDIQPVEVLTTGETFVVEREQPQSIVFFGGPGILIDDSDFFPAYVMNYILGGGGFASRLTEEVREKRGLAYGVSTYFNPYEFGGIFVGTVATDNDRIAESLGIIKSEVARLRDEGVTEEELVNAKTYLTGSFPLHFDSNSKIANQLVGYQLIGRGIDYINTRNSKIEAVISEDIARVAKRLLDPDALTVVIVGKPNGVEQTVDN